MEIHKTLAEFVDMLSKFEEHWGCINRALEIKEDEQQDLLHDIELSDFNAYEGYRIYKTLQGVRRERRNLKREKEMAEILKEMLEVNFGSQMAKRLKEALKKMDDKQAYFNSATYWPRIRDDLKLISSNKMVAADG